MHFLQQSCNEHLFTSSNGFSAMDARRMIGLLILAVLMASAPRQPLLVREMGEQRYVSMHH